MELKKLTTCRQCGKVFLSVRAETCPKCMEYLDSCFRVIRKYLDDNPRTELNPIALSQKLNIDLQTIRALIGMKYFEPIVIPGTKEEVTKKVKLARRIQASLAQSLGMNGDAFLEKSEEPRLAQDEKDTLDTQNAMFAQERHGTKKRDR